MCENACDARHRWPREIGLVLVLLAGCTSHWEANTFRELNQVGETIRDTAPDLGQGAVEDYVSYARARSPELRAAYERWRADALRVSRARRLPNPTVSYSYFARSVETRVGPQQHRLSVRQSFPWPTKLTAGADAASLRARAQQRRFEARALALQARVAQNYWRLWMVRKVRDVRSEQVELYGQLAEIVRGRLETGAATLAQLQQLELARARVQDTVDGLAEVERAESAALVSAIGAPFDTQTPTRSDAPLLGVAAVSTEDLVTAARTHPAVVVFSELAAAGDAQARSVRAGRYPGFTLGLDWIQTGRAISPTPDNGADPVILTLGVSVPLWQGSLGDEARAEQAQAEAFRAEGEASVNERVAQMQATLAASRDALRQYVLHRDTLRPQAQALHESVVSSYVVGRASIADMLMAERDLLQIREREIEAAARHAREWARFEAVLGRAVERDLEEEQTP